MKTSITLPILLLMMHTTIQSAVTPKMPMPIIAPQTTIPPVMPIPKAIPVVPTTPITNNAKSEKYSIVIPVAYDIQIINTCPTPATLNAITIQYTTSSTPNKIQAVTATTQTAIPANKGISFRPKITINAPEQNISTQFQGITGLTINSQPIIFPNPKIGTSPIYITNIGGAWKLTTKPTPKAIVVPKAVSTPKTISTVTPKITPPITVAPKINSTQAATVPYLKTTHPNLPIMPKAPIMKPTQTPKLSMAAKASKKAIGQTTVKEIA